MKKIILPLLHSTKQDEKTTSDSTIAVYLESIFICQI